MAALVSNNSQSSEVMSILPHAVWRANQMGSYQAPVTPSGYKILDSELPNGGWPSAALIELLLQQPGIGEMRLLRPALSAIACKRRIALIQPPHPPQAAAWLAWGLPHEHLLWVKTRRSADALWSAEQILRNGSCGALLFWQTHARPESLRRLHLAAQASDILFWMMRPLASAQDASAAPLRLGLRPAPGGLQVDLFKRRGPQRDEPLYLLMNDQPTYFPTPSSSHHAFLDRRTPVVASSGNVPATLV